MLNFDNFNMNLIEKLLLIFSQNLTMHQRKNLVKLTNVNTVPSYRENDIQGPGGKKYNRMQVPKRIANRKRVSLIGPL